MTKSKWNKELKGFWNGIKDIEGVRIANVQWLNEPWRIIENDETFDEAKNEGVNAPIMSFHTRDELYNAIYKGKKLD